MKAIREEQLVHHIIQMMKQKALKDYKKRPVKRSAHAKTLAILKGYLKVDNHLPDELKTELFKEGEVYPAIIRISNSSIRDKDDSKKDIRGFAIKIYVENQVQDWILVSTQHMPLRNIEGFEAAICLLNRMMPIRSLIRLVRNMRLSEGIKLMSDVKHQTSPLDILYYSVTPYKCGREWVKYCLVPTSKYRSEVPFYLTPTYLRDNMKKHLNAHQATFNLMVQCRRKGMSIEDASQHWSETISPFVKVGEVIIMPQVFDTLKRRTLGEKLSFSPGHTLVGHEPLGELNRARVKIYKAMSCFRKTINNK